MADQAWIEVHGLIETPGPSIGTRIDTVIPIALQETALTHFHAYDDPADWRVRDRGVRSVVFVPNGNRLYVTETYAQLQNLVKLKR